MGSRAKKRLKTKLGKKVLAGKLTVSEARARLGREFAQKSAAPAVVKAGARADLAGAMRDAAAAFQSARPMTYEDVMAAARSDMSGLREELLRKSRNARPARRPDPQRELMALKSWQASQDAAAAARPVVPLTGVQRGLLDVYRTHSDSQVRENARQALVDEGVFI
jgi:hypothetical protein